MDSINTEIEVVHSDQHRPELSPEDKMVSSYLEARSEIYRDLVKVQDDVSDSKLFHHKVTLH